jgi:transcriptional regulator with XRE-family HTH domain
MTQELEASEGFGAALRRRRKGLGLTQRDTVVLLAQYGLNLVQSAISDYELGVLPSVEVYEALVKALGELPRPNMCREKKSKGRIGGNPGHGGPGSAGGAYDADNRIPGRTLGRSIVTIKTHYSSPIGPTDEEVENAINVLLRRGHK